MSDTSELDKAVEAILALVQSRTEELEKDKETINVKWKTPCRLTPSTLPGILGDVNLQVVNLEQLKLITVAILIQQQSLTEVNEVLELPEEPIQIGGYPIEDWLTDCKKRAKVLTIKAKEEDLKALKKRAEGLQSEAQKRAREIKELMSSVGLTI